MTLLAILGVLSSAIFSGTSLLFATLGETIHQRSGIVNLGMEGVMLVSAASGFAVTVISGNPYLGVFIAMIAGGLMNMVMGFLVVTRRANQLASGRQSYIRSNLLCKRSTNEPLPIQLTFPP